MIIATMNGICKDGARMDDLIHNVNSLVITDGADKCKHCEVCNKHGKSFSNLQKLVYHQVHSSIDKETKKVILIDAPSGTGKSYMLARLALEYGESLHFAVFRKDQSSDLSLKQIQSYTYVSYNMRNFQLQYYDAIRMFDVSGLYNIDVFFLLLLYAKKYVHVRHQVKVIILDAYTVASPLMLLLLYIVSLKNEITLIFAGNKLQLGSINKSPLHGRNNYDMLEIFSHQTIHELTTNERTTDTKFLKKLLRYRDLIASYASKADAPFYFNLRYFLYRMFPDKYHPAITEDFHSVYMAPVHRAITKRMYRFMKSLKPEDYYVSQFSNVPFDEMDKKTYKFFPGLLLVKGCKYVHITDKGVHHIVELLEFNKKNETVDSLTVRYADGKTLSIFRNELNYYQILPAYRRWLKKYAKLTAEKLIQFPLRPYALTYHAALGRTINDTVELDTNCPLASSVYVGLCCLPSESVIRKFHAETDFLSFIATRYMEAVDNKMYYYRYPSTDVDGPTILEHLNTPGGSEYITSFMKGIPWVTVTNINNFERSTTFVRIKRIEFEKAKKEINMTVATPLMELAKFIKDSPTIVLNTIKKIPDVDMNLMVRTKEYRTWETYASLNEAFKTWKATEKENEKK